jgi:hypothetical protein
MPQLLLSALLAATVTTACVIPPGTLSNTITTGFGIIVQNPAFPVIHDRYMNLDAAGGGDQHLFLDPVGARTFNLVLNSGSLAQGIIHAVINGEVRILIIVDSIQMARIHSSNDQLLVFRGRQHNQDVHDEPW